MSGFGETPKKTPPEEIPPAAMEQSLRNQNVNLAPRRQMRGDWTSVMLLPEANGALLV
jgi:hypothetical protein